VLLRVEKWCYVLVRVVVIRTLRVQGEAQLLRIVVPGEIIEPRHAAVLGDRSRVAGGVDALQLAGGDLGAELARCWRCARDQHLLDEADVGATLEYSRHTRGPSSLSRWRPISSPLALRKLQEIPYGETSATRGRR
jgi:hypothetical protein